MSLDKASIFERTDETKWRLLQTGKYFVKYLIGYDYKNFEYYSVLHVQPTPFEKKRITTLAYEQLPFGSYIRLKALVNS